MNAHLALNRVWPLVLLLAAIALVLHASQAAGETPHGLPVAPLTHKSACCAGTWCDGCCTPAHCQCDDYCPKPLPCVRLPRWCWNCPDYDAKCPPAAPCRVPVGCADDYCPKPCPKCPPPTCRTACESNAATCRTAKAE